MTPDHPERPAETPASPPAAAASAGWGQDLARRIGWQEHLKPFLYKQLPARTGWSATLGSLCVMLFALLAVSGLGLALYYNPSPDKAYQSVDYIMKAVPSGAILRGLHHWGASAMVLCVFLHLMATFFAGSHQAPRELTWIAGVGLLLITLGLGFTGYLLPWDMKAFWATVVSTNIPRDLPVFGKFVTRVALGGENVSGLTLTRFYAIHAMLLPALLALLAAIHIYLVRLHGLAEPAAEEPASSPQAAAPVRPYRFYPEHAWRSALAFAAVLAILLALARFGHIPREPIAGTLADSYLPRPEWYYLWLFQLLTYFPGKWETVGSLGLPIAGVGLLFAVPFLGRNRRLGAANRPLGLAVGVTAIVGIVYLTVLGFAGARPYGEVVPVPDRALTASEQRGLALYVDRDCAYCHQIRGQGGRRVGPDLSNLTAKRRSRAYLAKFVKNPQAVNAGSIMPKYELPEADLAALADFMLALDFSRQPMRLRPRAEAAKAAQN
jgi:quinol-cytochrome oxidoreductase complex cytochrome b subunit